MAEEHLFSAEAIHKAQQAHEMEMKTHTMKIAETEEGFKHSYNATIFPDITPAKYTVMSRTELAVGDVVQLKHGHDGTAWVTNLEVVDREGDEILLKRLHSGVKEGRVVGVHR